MLKILKITLIFPLVMIGSSALAFMDSLFNKSASAVAIAEGTQDLVEEFSIINDMGTSISALKSSIDDVHGIVEKTEGLGEDAQFIMSDMSNLDDVVSRLQTTVDKTRRAKRLARTLGIISTDPVTATAFATARDNQQNEDFRNEQKEYRASSQARAHRAFAFAARNEMDTDQSIRAALSDVHRDQAKSNLSFNPFPAPKDMGLKSRIISEWHKALKASQ